MLNLTLRDKQWRVILIESETPDPFQPTLFNLNSVIIMKCTSFIKLNVTFVSFAKCNAAVREFLRRCHDGIHYNQDLHAILFQSNMCHQCGTCCSLSAPRHSPVFVRVCIYVCWCFQTAPRLPLVLKGTCNSQ